MNRSMGDAFRPLSRKFYCFYCAWSHAGWGQGLFVIRHRAEIAHIKPAFKEARMNRGSAMGMASQDSWSGADD
jgi:hypothetical protein